MAGLNVNTYDFEGYSSDFSISGTANIPLPGGGLVTIGGGGDKPPQYSYYGGYQTTAQQTIFGLSTVGILVIALVAFLLLRS